MTKRGYFESLGSSTACKIFSAYSFTSIKHRRLNLMVLSVYLMSSTISQRAASFSWIYSPITSFSKLSKFSMYHRLLSACSFRGYNSYTHAVYMISWHLHLKEKLSGKSWCPATSPKVLYRYLTTIKVVVTDVAAPISLIVIKYDFMAYQIFISGKPRKDINRTVIYFQQADRKPGESMKTMRKLTCSNRW